MALIYTLERIIIHRFGRDIHQKRQAPSFINTGNTGNGNSCSTEPEITALSTINSLVHLNKARCQH